VLEGASGTDREAFDENESAWINYKEAKESDQIRKRTSKSRLECEMWHPKRLVRTLWYTAGSEILLLYQWSPLTGSGSPG
jgi:hypothetical protein